jgi:hypothetical protein
VDAVVFLRAGDRLARVVGQDGQQDERGDEDRELERREHRVERERARREHCEGDDEKRQDAEGDDVDGQVKYRVPVEGARRHTLA